MTDHDAASEQVAETVPGDEAQLKLNPHLGHLDPDQGQAPDGDKAEADETEEASGDSPSPAEEDGVKETRDPVEKKVAELAFENRQLKRQLEQQAQQSAPQEPEQREPLKTLKDFGYDEQKFNDYLIDEGAKRAESRMAARQAETQTQTESQKRADEFAAREDAFELENPGFKTRLHDDNLRITPEMASFIADPTSDIGLHVGDYLARNPTEAAKIAAMSETAQMREMVKLETRIGKEVAKAKAEKEKASGAPPPPKTRLDGTDADLGLDPSSAKDSDKMSDEEWSKRRQRQLEKRRNTR